MDSPKITRHNNLGGRLGSGYLASSTSPTFLSIFVFRALVLSFAAVQAGDTAWEDRWQRHSHECLDCLAAGGRHDC
jgi:hypothetical protein